MAIRQSPEFVIDGESYKVSSLPATKSRGLNLRLTKAAAPGLALAAAQGATEIDTLLKTALEGLDESLLDDLCDAFSKATQIGGIPTIIDERGFNEHFSGRILSMYKWLFECLKHEYSDFLSAFPDLKSIAGEQNQESE